MICSKSRRRALSVVINKPKNQVAVSPGRSSYAEVENPQNYRDCRRHGNQLLRLRYSLMDSRDGLGSLLCRPGPVIAR